MDLIEAGENSVEINYLESLGFNPKFCTGYCKRWGYGEYQCFDIRYREKGGIIYDMSSILDRAAQ